MMSTGTENARLSLKTVKLDEAFWVVVFNLLLFETALWSIHRTIYYIDEAAVLLFSGVAVVKALHTPSVRYLSKQEICALLLLGVFAFIGIWGNVTNEIQTRWYPIAIDVFACAKFVLMLLSAYIVFDDTNRLLHLLLVEVKALLLVMLACLFVDSIVDIGMGKEEKFGIRAFQFIFPHPTYVAFVVTGILILLLSDTKKNRIYIAIALLLSASTLRSKAIGFSLIALLFLWSMGNKKNLYPVYFVLAIAGALMIAWDQFLFYYGGNNFAREALTRTSLTIAERFFPLGAGFAGFGSAITAEPGYYSPLYETYGLSGIYGLTRESPVFVSDTFWPIILGQNGWLGAVCFTVAIGLLAFSSYRRSQTYRTHILAPTLTFIFLLISSTGETAFFNPASIYLVFCLAVVTMDKRRPCENQPPS